MPESKTVDGMGCARRLLPRLCPNNQGARASARPSRRQLELARCHELLERRIGDASVCLITADVCRPAASPEVGPPRCRQLAMNYALFQGLWRDHGMRGCDITGLANAHSLPPAYLARHAFPRLPVCSERSAHCACAIGRSRGAGFPGSGRGIVCRSRPPARYRSHHSSGHPLRRPQQLHGPACGRLRRAGVLVVARCGKGALTRAGPATAAQAVAEGL